VICIDGDLKEIENMVVKYDGPQGGKKTFTIFWCLLMVFAAYFMCNINIFLKISLGLQLNRIVYCMSSLRETVSVIILLCACSVIGFAKGWGCIVI